MGALARRHAGKISLGAVAILLAVGMAANAHHSTPRCLSDDFNDGSQALCYTVQVDTGERIYIDSTDTVVSR